MQGQVTTPFLQSSRRVFLTGAITAVAGAIALNATPVRADESTMTPPEAHMAAVAGDIILVDIRTPPEWAETGIGEGAIALDMTTGQDFVNSLVKLRKAFPEKPIAVICRTGSRSTNVYDILSKQGFPGLVNIPEGMAGGRNGKGWIPRGLPTYPGTKEEIEKRLNDVMEPA